MKNEEKVVLLEKMLGESIDILVENEICTGCCIFHGRDYRCKSGNFCADLIYEGLFEKVRRNQEK